MFAFIDKYKDKNKVILCTLDCVEFYFGNLNDVDINSILFKLNEKRLLSMDMFEYLQNRDIKFIMRYKYLKEISFKQNMKLFRKIYIKLMIEKYIKN
jgi:hypothetical protein